MNETLLLLVPLLPALGALINGARAFANPKTPKNRTITNVLALGTTLLSAIIATIIVLGSASEPWQHTYYVWIPAGIGHVGSYTANFAIDFAFRIDHLSSTMLMIVTWIGFLIHVYATGYMAHETGYTRFFTYLNLFMFMMLLLVLGANYLVMFVGWEGVGLCSYLLIGFYYDKNFAADAGKKAFIANRIGDFGFVLGIFLIFNTFGTADYATVFARASANPAAYTSVATAICLLLFVGACGKSAQIPLYVWLPDAMAGPTPVSALIHAATMVTAGVYMVVRSNVLFRMSPDAMAVVATIGAVTALFAATIGIAQYDIKKVLAYSTVSQLGYMFLAAGVGAFASAIFHVMTHAFFKACLFLGAGSVIHGCGGEQDMRKMGGLRKSMPATRMTMLLACIAIAGFPPLAGFFSKDEILSTTYEHHGFLYALGMIAATCTSFYMFRLYFMTFSGDYRGADDKAHDEHAHGDHGHAHDPHESPKSMTLVLWILAIGAVIGGLVGLPEMFGGVHPTWFQRWLAPGFLPLGHEAYEFAEASRVQELLLILSSVVVATIGWAIAFALYYKDGAFVRATRMRERFAFAHRVLTNKYYVDEFYNATIIYATLVFSRFLSWFDANIIDGLVNLTRHIAVYPLGYGSSLFDRFVVDGAVNGIASTAKFASKSFRKMQSGFVQNYALVMGGGIVLITVVYLFLKP